MTRNEIISMARKAGFPFNKYGALKGDDYGEIDADEMFERFAALVAAAEREACARACRDVIDGGQYDEYQQYAAAACRDEIRARGKKGQS
jgi:hypothetical protein